MPGKEGWGKTGEETAWESLPCFSISSHKSFFILRELKFIAWMCVISSLKASSLKLCMCVWVCTHVQGEFRRGIRWNLEWVFPPGPPAVWSQDTCVPCLPPYFLCKWEFLQYMMDGCLGEWMDSKQSRYSLGLHTVTAGRCSHSSSFLQFSDPPNPLIILYLGSLGSQMDPHFCHRNKC